ncbi:MAG: hypothetical protein SFT92_08370 [Rickettsiales bacterium]|nr:hypothetical protein [Rickettsiales bacterium]
MVVKRIVQLILLMVAASMVAGCGIKRDLKSPMQLQREADRKAKKEEKDKKRREKQAQEAAEKAKKEAEEVQPPAIDAVAPEEAK